MAAGPVAQPSATPAMNPSFPQPQNWPAVTSAVASTETIGPGVLYQRWKLVTSSGPLELSVATIDLHNPYVALSIGIQAGRIAGPGERLSSMADRVGAEVGVNADYFDINESGSPLNVVAIGNRVLHQPDRAAAFVVGANKQLYMGPLNWSAKFSDSKGATIGVTSVNEWSPSVDLALLTPEFDGKVTLGASEIVLDPVSMPGQYRVASVDRKLKNFPVLGTGQIAIVVKGSQADAVVRGFSRGSEVTMTTRTEPGVDMQSSVGGGPLLVQAGLQVEDPAPPAPEETEVRNPVTGAGVSKDGSTLWLVAVDGRAPSRSIGLTRPQLGSLFIALGADTAMAFDSGGSSEMVVRHLGDFQSDVTGRPSDGRERSIADGLFVLNTAPQGAAVRLLLRPKAAIDPSMGPGDSTLPSVLVGSSLQIEAGAMDANDQPISLAQTQVSYSVAPPDLATVDATGVFRAQKPGQVQISATAFGAQGSAQVTVVPQVDDLQILGPPNVPVNSKRSFFVSATTKDGQSIALDPTGVSWGVTSPAAISADGVLTVGPQPQKMTIMAKTGGATATVVVLSGEHAIIWQALPTAGTAEGAWQFVSQPANLSGVVDNQPAPDRAAALHLSYDFSSIEGVTRAAYAQTAMSLPGEPSAASIDVFGSRNNEWLRGGYRNADGNNESLTIARHVDWKGWKTVRFEIPAQPSWPVTWTRFYVVEPVKTSRQSGSLWFRNFDLIYPGPA